MRVLLTALLMLPLVACNVEDLSATDQSPVEVRLIERPELPPMPKSLRLEDIDFTSYSTELARFADLAIGQSRIEAIDAVRLNSAPEEGDVIIQTSQSTFERDDGAVMILTASGLPDDSVKAEEYYLIFTGPEGDQTLASYGARIQCYRGENTTEWQTERCP